MFSRVHGDIQVFHCNFADFADFEDFKTMYFGIGIRTTYMDLLKTLKLRQRYFGLGYDRRSYHQEDLQIIIDYSGKAGHSIPLEKLYQYLMYSGSFPWGLI